MEVKKNPKVDLDAKKSIFSEIGLVVALGVTLAAFEWTSEDVTIKDLEVQQQEVVEEEMVPVTTQDQIKPPPPPPPPPPVADALTIVDNETEINEDFELNDTEADDNTEFEIRDLEPAVVEEEEPAEQEVFIIVEQMPVFPGGDAELRKYLATSVKYPTIAQENGIQGRVFVKFVIMPDGSVSNVEVARPFDPNLDREAVRVVKSMPKWTPGKQRGKAVRVSYTVPINFVLQ